MAEPTNNDFKRSADNARTKPIDGDENAFGAFFTSKFENVFNFSSDSEPPSPPPSDESPEDRRQRVRQEDYERRRDAAEQERKQQQRTAQWNKMAKLVNEYTRAYVYKHGLDKEASYEEQAENILNSFENTRLLMIHFGRCKNKGDLILLLATFSKIYFKGSMIMRIYNANIPKYINEIWQSLTAREVESGNPFSQFREILTNFEDLRNTQLFKKVYKLLMYVLTLSFFEKAGFTMDNFNFDSFQQEAMRRKFYMGADFYICLLDTVSFICERGYEYYITGDVASIVCDPGKYGDWFDDFNTLKKQFTHINDPEPFGFTESSFLALLDDTLDKGHSILKHSYSLDKYQQSYISNKVSELHIMRDDLYSKRHCREDRIPPFSVLVSGDSGIGKSTIKDILFYFFAKIKKLESDSSMRYTRNALANFWDGFTTSQWCIVLDDIGAIHVTKAPNGDPSLMEVLQIVNQVAYVPDQASLNDKGRTPMRPRLVIGTTNTENLNANAYFSCPSAVQRRFPFIIVPEVREEFKNDSQMLDSSKVDDSRAYPDYWLWTVKRVKPRFGKERRNLAIPETVLDKVDIKTFLTWYASAIREHDNNQDKVKQSVSNIKTMDLCDCCELPIELCEKPKEYPMESRVIQKEVDKKLIYLLKPIPILSPLLFYWPYLYIFLCFMMIFIFITVRFIVNSYVSKYKNKHPLYFKCLHYGIKLNNYMPQKYKLITPDNDPRDSRQYWETLPTIMTVNSLKPAFFVTLGAFCTIALGFYRVYRKTENFKLEGAALFKDSEVSAESDTAHVPQPEDTEKENPWFKRTFNLSELPLSNNILCSKSLPLNAFIKRISRNCCYASIVYPEVKASRPLRITGIGGTIYMTNNHNLHTDGAITLQVISKPKTDGITPNVVITIHQHDILRKPDEDICFFRIPSMPPRASLLEYFVEDLIESRYNGKMVSRGKGGEVVVRNVRCITALRDQKSPVHRGNMYFGRIDLLTENGDCGSIVVLDTPSGRVLSSIHILGSDPKAQLQGLYTSHSTQIKKSTVAIAVEHFKMQCGGSEPLSLSSESAERTLSDLHFKSPFRYIEHGVAEVYGSFVGYRPAPKTRVSRTPMHDFLARKGIEEKYTSPQMTGYVPWRIALLDMVKPHHPVNSRAIQHCVDSFTSEIIGSLSSEIKDYVKVYTDFVAINGAAGVTYVDLMKRSTSAGNPWKKQKKFFLEKDEPQHGLLDPVKATPEIMDRVAEIEQSYRSCKRVYPNFCAHLKDEAVTFAKAKMGKTRVFTGAPMDFSIVNRKYFLSLIRLMQRNRFVFECGPGTISQSKEWHDIHAYLTTFSEEHVVAGDYKSFDKHMHPEFMTAAFEILYNVCEHSGNYDEGDLNAIKTMALDVVYPFVDYNGDLVQFIGVNPSGHPLTVIINGLVNCLYIRYVYYMLNPKQTCVDFKENVKLMTYGDDNIMGVNPDIPWFNHTSIQGGLATFGVVYTMADKSSASRPYINISEASFLKRTWRFDDEIGYYVCPLEEDSIERSMMTWVLSKTIEPEEQCCEIIRNASEEYFWYGEKYFTSKMKVLKELIRHLDLQIWFEDQPLNTWSELVYRYRKVSGLLPKDTNISELVRQDEENEKLLGIDISHANFQLQSSDWDFARCTCKIQNGDCNHNPPGRSPKILFRKVSVDTQEYKNSHRNDLSCSFHKQIAQQQNKTNLPQQNTAENRVLDAKVQEFSKQGNFPIQSEIGQTGMAVDSSQHQNVGFSDDNGGMEMSMSDTTDYMSIDHSTNIALGDFLSRPVNIFTYDWQEGVVPHLDFDPWLLYFTKGSIRRKLDHYYMLRCNLHLKIVINASPFYYGAALVSYRPLVNYNPASVDINPLAPQTALVSRSQRPHVYLYPTNSQGGEMILPFISEKQWLDVTTTTDLTNMGRISIDGLTALLNANSVTGSSATIQVFAWAEDVKLAGPTTKFALQSQDEYCSEEGPVSGVASAVANYADKANDVADSLSPYTGGLSLMIKPFATATSLASGAVSSIAKLFGYTNVPVIDNIHAFKPQPFPQFASPHIGTPVEKLTLDPKNELTVDPCVSGVKMEDELTISNLVTRESYLTQFDWTAASAENEVLFNSIVDPTLCQRDTAVNDVIIAGTPMWYVSKAFSYWRGDITFRFKFLCSQYHRGRVRISWDPIGTISTSTDPTTEIYTQIIDITKDTDVEFTVPYTQALPFKKLRRDNVERFSSSPIPVVNTLFDNGQLTVSVLTKQNSPVVSADVKVAVFVKGTPSLQFAAPRELDNNLSQYPVQSALEYDEPELIDIGVDSSEDTSSLNLLYMGEKVHSVRELMRRTQYVYSICDVTQNINRSTLISVNRRLPLLPGFDPNGISNANGIFSAVAEPFNFVNWTFLTWFSQAFVGSRGSIMWHANLDTRQEAGQLTISRNVDNTLTQAGYRTMVSTGDQDRSALSRYYLNSLPTGQSGMTLTNQHTQAGVSALVPMYSQYKFLSNDYLTRTLGDSLSDDSTEDAFIVGTSFVNNNDTTEDYNLHLFTCAGTDYNPVFFLNVPTFYEYPLQPTAAPL